MTRRSRLVVGVVALLLVVAAWRFSPGAIVDRLSWLANNPVYFALALLALAIVRPFLAWPTTLLAVAAGYGYGIVGFPVALVVMTLTALPPYLLARGTRGGGRFASAGERFVGETGDFRGVTASRLLPAPSDVVSVGAGVAGVGFTPYVLGTAVGEVPWAIVGVLAGASLGSLTADSLTSAVDVRLVGALALVGVLGLAGPVYRFLKDEGDSGSAAETADADDVPN